MVEYKTSKRGVRGSSLTVESHVVYCMLSFFFLKSDNILTSTFFFCSKQYVGCQNNIDSGIESNLHSPGHQETSL